MEIIGIDTKALESASRVILKRDFTFKPLDLFDERFYPSRKTEREEVLRYFLVMVALDHRLSRPGKPYEACIEEGCYHGADLLYRLGMIMFKENPEFFSPNNLCRVSIDDIKNWLSIGSAEPPDPEVRAFLLRDLGVKLNKLYGGKVENLLSSSKGVLRGFGANPGLIDLLRCFRAYEDPVEKKAMLLVKFLINRGLYKPLDKPDVPVDNHLSRIAYRLGIVMVSGKLWEKIRRGVEVDREEDVLLRLAVRRAYRMLVDKTGIDPCMLDDFFWVMGREVCIRDTPLCDKCVFRNVCLAKRNRSFMVSEHLHFNTWYY
ncbi:MAG: iron-sulfur cluster loop [Thermoprotei archaeon]|nr:MAG: iron-sulfur cluster loop [Thermoprotei archaeon]